VGKASRFVRRLSEYFTPNGFFQNRKMFDLNQFFPDPMQGTFKLEVIGFAQ
jgi:hypothetical protein